MIDYKNILSKRAELLFNNIKDGLFSYFYLIDSEEWRKGIDTPYSYDFFNLSELLNFNNLKDSICSKESENFSKLVNNSICKESVIVFSNQERQKCYRLCLFLDSKVYETVSSIDFLENLCESFLAFYSKEIQYGNTLVDEESAKQAIYTEAASNYLSDIIFSVYGEHNKLFYRNLLSLSTQKYESSVTKGKIILGKKLGKTNLFFEESISISTNLRMARKLIQLSNDEKKGDKGDQREKTFLICDSQEILGIHYKDGNINYDEDYFIYFTNYNSFCIKKGNGEKLLDVNGGIPDFPYRENKFDVQLVDDLKQIYPSIKSEKIDKLKGVIKSIVKFQKHGAVIVIEDNADEESKRLSNISIKIKDPKGVNTNGKNINKYKTFAEIDGAILMDFDACCYSFGVILDGKHLEQEGHKERGSRYNSSKRYLEQNKKKKTKPRTMIIVMSEDGGFDILK